MPGLHRTDCPPSRSRSPPEACDSARVRIAPKEGQTPWGSDPCVPRHRAVATIVFGGVPERANGAVLKTVDRREAVRGFESHPRRSDEDDLRTFASPLRAGQLVN